MSQTVQFNWNITTNYSQPVTITVGDSIHFISNDGTPHSLVSSSGPPNWSSLSTPFNFPIANPFDQTIQFLTPGTYYVKCTVHPTDMRLTIIVEEAPVTNSVSLDFIVCGLSN